MLSRLEHRKVDRQPACPICHTPVSLKTSKTDENGKAVHEDCYVSRICDAKATTVPKES